MCFAEEIQFRCGHYSVPVVRPCPLTTVGHNHPVCQIQFTYEYRFDTMCPACERIIHIRWTLVDDWEHRWYHERGVCRCGMKFKDLDNRPGVIAAGARNIGQADDEATLFDSPTACAVSTPGADKHLSPQVKAEHRGGEANIQPVDGHPARQDHGKGLMGVEGQQDQGPQEHVPALYEEITDQDKTHVAVRQPSKYAAEWLVDHREEHAAGRCHCGVETKPLTGSNGAGTMSAEEERVLALHHRITGDGVRPEEWTPPSSEEVDRWRKETKIPELGRKATFTVHIRRAPVTTKYPVPLGNNTFLTEHFVVWDAKSLASWIESMQITNNPNGNGAGQSVRVLNGTVPAAQEKVYVYQPSASGPSKESGNKGYRRPSGRNWSRRETVANTQNADLVGLGSPVSVPPYWQQHTSQNIVFDAQRRPGVGVAEFLQPGAPYGISVSQQQRQQQQETLRYGMPPSLTEQQSQNAIKQHMQTPHAMPPDHPAQPQLGSYPDNRTSNMTVTPPQQPTGTAPPVFHRIHGAEQVIGWYLTPPDTHAGKGVNGKLPTSTPDPDQTPTKPSQKADQPAALPPAIANGSHASPNQNGSGNGTSSDTTTSTAVTPCGKRKKTAARRLRIKQKKAEERRRREEQAAAANGNGNEKRRDVTPLCGLPIGAGPEGKEAPLPAVAERSLFRPIKTHHRGASCPQFPDTHPLISVSVCFVPQSGDRAIISLTPAQRD